MNSGRCLSEKQQPAPKEQLTVKGIKKPYVFYVEKKQSRLYEFWKRTALHCSRKPKLEVIHSQETYEELQLGNVGTITVLKRTCDL